MTTEIQMLVFSIILGFAQIILAISAATWKRGLKWNLSSRDQQAAPLSGVAGRLSRASHNFNETFPFFLAAVLIVQVLQKNSSQTAIGAQLYFWCRLVYVPIYAFDITVIRTAIWSLAMLGILIILAGTF